MVACLEIPNVYPLSIQSLLWLPTHPHSQPLSLTLHLRFEILFLNTLVNQLLVSYRYSLEQPNFPPPIGTDNSAAFCWCQSNGFSKICHLLQLTDLSFAEIQAAKEHQVVLLVEDFGIFNYQLSFLHLLEDLRLLPQI